MLLNPLQSRVLLDHALQNRYAILAVNADSPAAITDCFEAARLADAPLIIETSLWQLEGHSFGAGDAILGVARYLANIVTLADSPRYQHIPVIYHTDHIKGPKTFPILEAAIKGIPINFDTQTFSFTASTISLDASEFNHKETVQHIGRLCEFAKNHQVPITLEMEDAVDDGITTEEVTEYLLGSIEKNYPGQIYLWAPGTGTQHGFGEKMSFSPKTIEQQIRVTKKVTGREIGIALHGSTGLDKASLGEACRVGVIKVNWSTESLLIRSTAARRYYTEVPERFDRTNKSWKQNVMDNGLNQFVSEEYIPKVVERMEILGGLGKGSDAMKQLAATSAIKS